MCCVVQPVQLMHAWIGVEVNWIYRALMTSLCFLARFSQSVVCIYALSFPLIVHVFFQMITICSYYSPEILLLAFKQRLPKAMFCYRCNNNLEVRPTVLHKPVLKLCYETENVSNAKAILVQKRKIAFLLFEHISQNIFWWLQGIASAKESPGLWYIQPWNID